MPTPSATAIAAIWIRERDGVKIFKEVADQLLDRQALPDARQWKTRPTGIERVGRRLYSAA